MVQTAFLTVLGMSMAASLVILAVLLARLPLKKAPKVFSYALWAVALFRLLCPFSIESGLSLIPEQAMELPKSIASNEYEDSALWNNGYAARHTADDALNVQTGESGGHGRIWPLLLSDLWLVGIGAVVICSAVSYFKLRRRLIGAVPLRNNIYLADHITSPFVMGLLHPKIYLPSSLLEGEKEYIILHEQHHIRRLDHVVKALFFVALCIHWFNPLVWAAFLLSGNDMEMSCDEAVVKKLGAGVRADYSASLLRLATGRRSFAGTPLAFGEGDAVGRIKNLAKWKKPALWAVVAAAAVVALVFAVCGTNVRREAELEVKHLVNGMELTCHFEEAIQSWAIYEDIYLEGEMISSDSILLGDFQDNGGSSDRHRNIRLSYEEGFEGTLKYSWIFSKEGKANMERELPRDHYTGMAYLTAENDGNLEPDGSVILYYIVLSNQAEGEMTAIDPDTVIAANDTVIRYRLVTSTEECPPDFG